MKSNMIPPNNILLLEVANFLAFYKEGVKIEPSLWGHYYIVGDSSTLFLLSGCGPKVAFSLFKDDN